MKGIYSPAGRAREFSPLALNLYNGCSHRCTYCYLRTKYGQEDIKVEPRRILALIEKQAPLYARYGEQVLLCFAGDPYCPEELKFGFTRKVLEILLKSQVVVAILTKGGSRCLRDVDLFTKFKNIKVGATLTCFHRSDSKKWEPGAASPGDRIETLRLLRSYGIKTWVSFEPVITPQQTFRLLEITHEFIDHYKVGKMNYVLTDIDWKEFGMEIVKRLRKLEKKFYIKQDLQRYLPKGFLTKEEMDMDYLILKKENDE